MNHGYSLPGLLLALALGTAGTLLAVERFQALRSAQSLLLRRESDENAARSSLFELARDLRQHGAAGCHAVDDVEPGQIGYGAPGWSVEAVTLDARGALSGVQLRVLEPDAVLPAQIALASCTRLDLLPGSEVLQRERSGHHLRVILSPGLALPVGGDTGHHLASLEVMPWIARRYRYEAAEGQGQLVQENIADGSRRVLARAIGFSLQEQDGGWDIGLRSPGGLPPWRLFVARRQQGWALPTVLTLIFAAGLAFSVSQRVLLDESRMVGHFESWWQVLQLAETALLEAESATLVLDRLPGREHWFTPACRNPAAPVGWNVGLCSRTGAGGEVPAVWLRTAESGVLSACGKSACIRSGAMRSKPAHACPTTAAPVRYQVGACYVVELLDSRFRGRGGLYRITARAWDRRLRSSVTLQSYFHAETAVGRLAWRELW